MKKITQRLNFSRPKRVRVLEQHGTRPTYRREQIGAPAVVSLGGITFRQQ
jgi:hypothetical protein